MTCNEVLERLKEELNETINKSRLIHYDREKIVRPQRDSNYFIRNYSEKDYLDLKLAIKLSKSYVSSKIIREILELDRTITMATATILKNKSKMDLETSKQLMSRIGRWVCAEMLSDCTGLLSQHDNDKRVHNDHRRQNETERPNTS